MEKEYYLKINLEDTELLPLEVEQLLYKAIEKKLKRKLVFEKNEDVVCVKIEHYEKMK